MRAAQNTAQNNERRNRFYKPGLQRRSGSGSNPLRDRSRHGQIFLPGQPVPETGIYEVMHHREHRVAHEVVMHGKDLFPPCDQCDLLVRFKLIRTAPYIFDDEDFAEEP